MEMDLPCVPMFEGASCACCQHAAAQCATPCLPCQVQRQTCGLHAKSISIHFVSLALIKGIMHRLQKIREVAGVSGQDGAALDALMRGDFDPEDYDKHMAAAFGDGYYQVSFA